MTASTTQVRSDGRQLGQVARMFADGAVGVGIDSTAALADARRAHERAARGHLRATIVLPVS